MFRAVPLSIIRKFHCTHSNGVCHTGLLTACEQDQDGNHVSGSSSVHHQEFFTVNTADLLTACEQDQDGTAVQS